MNIKIVAGLIFVLFGLSSLCKGSDVGTPSTYGSYHLLKQHERQGTDYQIEVLRQLPDVVILAPHGGGIEPGTTELAFAIAGSDYTCYSFSGIKLEGNSNLHLTSTTFDEPVALNLVHHSRRTITLHGLSSQSDTIYVGGRDRYTRHRLENSLQAYGFQVDEHPAYAGTNLNNICNRNQNRAGVQIELPNGIRQKMFASLDREGRTLPTPLFYTFVTAVRQAIR
ncbi:MAG: replication protein [Gemmatimonadetes bacterium]|nr:MAG: replication protein [Gemmatimonadota bacterium]